MRKRAYAASRSMTWAQTAKRYLAAFETARERRRTCNRRFRLIGSISRSKDTRFPEVRIGHFLSLCDSTGMLQHAVHSVPDRAHGYCVDDNARALLLSSALASSGEAQLSETMTARFAAFIQHAWNPDTRRFRNFMSYDRRWLEETGSEDSHGRTLWALGECARDDTDPSRRRWAAALFKTALPAVEDFSSPRAWAFTLLGLDAYCALVGGDLFANRMRGLLADRLMSLFAATETKDWLWFEDVLAYDNARLPQALIQTGAGDPARRATSRPACDRCAGSWRCRPRRRDASGPSAPRASAGRARSPKRSISSPSRRQQRFPPALRHGGWTTARSGRQGRCARSIGFWAKTTCRHR